MARAKRTKVPKPPRPPKIRRAKKRGPMLPAFVTVGVVAVLSWLVSWWAVPIAGAIAGAVWPRMEKIGALAMWGAAGGWVLLLLVDSIQGRTIALARALGGAVFLPWPLLIIVTLLFAAGLAWSAAVVAATVARRFSAR
jgi:hypothetical protein